jgi:hypothetical protein
MDAVGKARGKIVEPYAKSSPRCDRLCEIFAIAAAISTSDAAQRKSETLSASLDAFPTCNSAETPAKYSVITCGKNTEDQVAQTYYSR